MDMTIRPRRLRKSETLRKMVRETRMDKSSLIYPLFVKEGENIEEEIPSMEGQYRYSIDRLPYELERLQKAGVDKVMFFGIPDVKDEVGSQAYAEDGIVQKAIREAKKQFPDMYLITDVCVSILLMVIVVYFADMMWKMIKPLNYLQKQRFLMCRQVQIWLHRLI